MSAIHPSLLLMSRMAVFVAVNPHLCGTHVGSPPMYCMHLPHQESRCWSCVSEQAPGLAPSMLLPHACIEP